MRINLELFLGFERRKWLVITKYSASVISTYSHSVIAEQTLDSSEGNTYNSMEWCTALHHSNRQSLIDYLWYCNTSKVKKSMSLVDILFCPFWTYPIVLLTFRSWQYDTKFVKIVYCVKDLKNQSLVLRNERFYHVWTKIWTYISRFFLRHIRTYRDFSFSF